ncbi:hypothetical protein PCC7424_5455 (plasmid) [Gloeothece citriformis PCC 7424]|uniref:Uncharacterized protein n=1 Tax=Gloeothece citriformis (strain PCC 7424) TaxID=65393 RepID=B7KLT9_GLOC7|nr:hypothetical protein [Gloeothece citriformis]ACK73761.1 hypothetical protein PCC7424_5694 [Gloeothece citriformis PCC 7424]ACK74027.1 hypothetical protein PCC7424_5455 [Gloeothece citriformis PCC 7424]
MSIAQKIKESLKSVQQEELPPFPADMEIETVEFFDQEGIMGGSTPLGSFELNRYDDHVFEYIALYLNGVLAYFLEKPGLNEKVLFNRVQNLKGVLNPIGR